jgi:hypothetical protein
MDRKIETFDTGMGKIDAHLVTEMQYQDGKLVPRSYVEVYEHGESDPSEMIAWFGSLESFAHWNSGAEIVGF